MVIVDDQRKGRGHVDLGQRFQNGEKGDIRDALAALVRRYEQTQKASIPRCLKHFTGGGMRSLPCLDVGR